MADKSKDWNTGYAAGFCLALKANIEWGMAGIDDAWSASGFTIAELEELGVELV